MMSLFLFYEDADHLALKRMVDEFSRELGKVGATLRATDFRIQELNALDRLGQGLCFALANLKVLCTPKRLHPAKQSIISSFHDSELD
jgi:hypothetical protein